jgi:hypothetical protein
MKIAYFALTSLLSTKGPAIFKAARTLAVSVFKPVAQLVG